MYDYKIERDKIFTEQGQKLFLSIRDTVNELIFKSGACTLGKAINGQTGSAWEMIACMDRLVELGEIDEIPTSGPAQYRIFTKGIYGGR